MKINFSRADVTAIEGNFCFVDLSCAECKKKKAFRITKYQAYDLLSPDPPTLATIFPQMKPEDREMFRSRICGLCMSQIMADRT